ncbi:citrate transporter [Campylobacter sp. Marseille-Q3452]|uniref:Citrate transporter n=1 Tax=Campylobacter massiliensis TaxID=2762557 RepID=A0A842J3G5_9BACT|nr:citrate transporter [Campylobacter massiliensis]MBC2882317.1 citrate transporter [Campylobacter massiliensis]
MDMSVVVQILMLVVLALMITGRTPLYITAIIGSTIVAIVAGFPMSGKDGATIANLVKGGLNPVIADMTGVLLFLGILEGSGFLAVIVRSVIRFGIKIGGGPGICAAASTAAGIMGMLTGYSPPIVTGAIAGPAAIKMSCDPNQTAGTLGHAGGLGNFGGFTHPTQVALIATAGIGFGAINIVGAICAMTIILASFTRMYFYMKKRNLLLSRQEIEKILEDFKDTDSRITSFKAFLPFILLLAGFVSGLPIFIVGMACGVVVIFLARLAPGKGENMMIEGLTRMAIPLVATIGFLFMSGVIKNIGMIDSIRSILEPLLNISPILVMLMVSIFAGIITQSYSASGALTIPMLTVVISAGADPLAACVAAAGGSALTQHFLTGGPVANLPTLIPVCEGSDLKTANRFQRPSILCGVAMVIVFSFVINLFA